MGTNFGVSEEICEFVQSWCNPKMLVLPIIASDLLVLLRYIVRQGVSVMCVELYDTGECEIDGESDGNRNEKIAKKYYNEIVQRGGL